MSDPPPRMRRNVAVLALCQALMQSGNALLIATSGLVGLALAPRPMWATVPLGLQFLGTMVLTLPASLLMQRTGRRRGFWLGTLLGALGAALCAGAVAGGGFAAFCVGSLSIGAFNAFGQYYRFAAADAATPEFRSRAISLVLAGGVVAAFLGPNLASWTRELFGLAPFVGSYASLFGLYVLSAVTLRFLALAPSSPSAMEVPARRLPAIVRQPPFLVAVACAMVSYGVMNLIMVATPLAMMVHAHPFDDTASVIQWHVLGMFAPSFATGHLIHRLGVLNIMLLGGVLLLACVGVNLSGFAMAHFWGGLFLLGVGWNFLFTGATTLLTETYHPTEKALAQGLNDLMVFSTTALTAVTSGLVHDVSGWTAINFGVLPFIGLAMLGTWWLRAHRRPAPPAGADVAPLAPRNRRW